MKWALCELFHHFVTSDLLVIVLIKTYTTCHEWLIVLISCWEKSERIGKAGSCLEFETLPCLSSAGRNYRAHASGPQRVPRCLGEHVVWVGARDWKEKKVIFDFAEVPTSCKVLGSVLSSNNLVVWNSMSNIKFYYTLEHSRHRDQPMIKEDEESFSWCFTAVAGDNQKRSSTLKIWYQWGH